jgi:hypothetical protein
LLDARNVSKIAKHHSPEDLKVAEKEIRGRVYTTVDVTTLSETMIKRPNAQTLKMMT